MAIRSGWRARLLTLVVSSAVVLLLAEAALRILGIDLNPHNEFYGCCGRRSAPNSSFWYSSEARVFVTNNSRGFRDREHAVKKPPGTLRIAVLGDSFAEALQVPLAETFWSVVERELATCPQRQGRTVEVLNFGVSGYGTTQQLQVLRHEGWQYEPDIVLLAFLPANDVQENSRELGASLGRPFYTLENGRLVLDETFRQAPMKPVTRTRRWLVGHSRVLGVAYRALAKLRSPRPTAPPESGEAGLTNFAFAPPRDPAWQRAWAVTEGVIGLMHDEVRSRRAEFLVVELNTGIQVHPDPEVIAAFARRIGANDVDEPGRRLSRLARERGLSFFSLTEPMRALAQRDKIFFHGFPATSPGVGHWNERGHGVAGKLIAAELCGHLAGVR